MPRLIHKSPKTASRIYPIDKDMVTLGRTPDNDIQLDQNTVSRNHALIEKRNDGYHLRDLSSTNGSYLNGIIIKDALLKKGDIIRLGSFSLTFDEKASDTISMSPEAPLAVLQQVGKAINKIMGEEDLMNTVMEMLFSIFKVDRGLVLLIDQNTGELEPKLMRGFDDKGKVPVSKTLIDHVVGQKLGLIVFDTLSDPRFKNSESMIGSDMGSIMCVPMLIRDEVIGLIQIGFSKGGNAFAAGDLDLVCSISDYLAIGIEQARLNEHIKAEARVRANLERFHSPEVVNKIVSNLEETGDVGMEVEEKEASILFADICNFTSLSESLPPVEVMALLNDYFTHMTDIIFDCGGTLDKYIGDAVMALFGVPYREEGNADRAVEAAIKMQEMTRRFAKDKKGSHRLRIRIGINTGRVVAGNIGSPKRMEYSVIGDTVNVASRLCGICEPGQILMGDRTIELLTVDHGIKPLGKKMVKGKKQGVMVHELRCGPQDYD